MSRGNRPVADVLSDALSHLDAVADYATGNLNEQKTVDAICMRLSAAIEALADLDETTRTDLFGSTWPQMWGMRNRIAHGYLLVNPPIVRATVERDLPIITRAVRLGLRETT